MMPLPGYDRQLSKHFVLKSWFKTKLVADSRRPALLRLILSWVLRGLVAVRVILSDRLMMVRVRAMPFFLAFQVPHNHLYNHLAGIDIF